MTAYSKLSDIQLVNANAMTALSFAMFSEEGQEGPAKLSMLHFRMIKDEMIRRKMTERGLGLAYCTIGFQKEKHDFLAGKKGAELEDASHKWAAEHPDDNWSI